MAWTLVEKTQRGQEIARHQLKSKGDVYLVLAETKDRFTVCDADQEGALACISIDSWHVKLVALSDGLGIIPARPRKIDSLSPSTERYKLSKRTPNQTEAIFIREQDTLAFLSFTTTRLTLDYDPVEIQVNSSVAVDADVQEPEERLVDGERALKAQNAQSDTEDEDLDQTVAFKASHSQMNGHNSSRETPGASVPRSEIVQETPAVNRIQPIDMSRMPEISDTSDAVADTPTGEDAAANDSDPFSTAQSKAEENEAGNGPGSGTEDVKDQEVVGEGPVPDTPSEELAPIASPAKDNEAPNGTDESNRSRASETPSEPPRKSTRAHPEVRIPQIKGIKRKDTPAALEDASAPPSRTPKRRKTDEMDTQDSSLSNINVDASSRQPKTPASRGRNRKSIAASQETPVSPVDSELLYTGDKPVVAFSNSNLQERPHLMKFLERHGGKQVEQVKPNDCNLLCIKDGVLRKSMKLLMAIALGIPIVADKWLIDSSKKGRLLSLESYIPSVPDQEQEWKFSLSNVLGKPQSDILSGYIMYFTPSYPNFKEASQLCKAVGAERVISKPARDVKDDHHQMILIGLEENDIDCAVLLEHGCTVFTKDFLILSILRGGIDLESEEFMLKGDGSSQREKPKKKGRARKS